MVLLAGERGLADRRFLLSDMRARSGPCDDAVIATLMLRHVYVLAVPLLGSRAIVANDPALTIERLAEGVYAFRPTDDAFKSDAATAPERIQAA